MRESVIMILPAVMFTFEVEMLRRVKLNKE